MLPHASLYMIAFFLKSRGELPSASTHFQGRKKEKEKKAAQNQQEQNNDADGDRGCVDFSQPLLQGYRSLCTSYQYIRRGSTSSRSFLEKSSNYTPVFMALRWSTHQALLHAQWL